MKAELVWIAITSCLLTLAAVWLALNLASGEKKIERQVERLYATEDPQFRRALGALLGPPIVEGNKVDVLLNGDAIFAVDAQGDRPGSAHASPSRPTSTGPETIGREFADALSERARAGVQGARAARLGRQRQDGAALSRRDEAGGRGSRAIPPAALVGPVRA